MTQNKFFRDLSAATFQVVFNQLFGLLIFYLLSLYLDKNTFGELNWSLAITWVLTTVLSLGTDYLIVKRIAAGQDLHKTGGLHMTHTLLAAALFIALLLAFRAACPVFFVQHNLLTGIAASALLTFLSSPFKQIANGREAFRNFAWMSITANASRAILLLAAAIFRIFSIRTVIVIYIASSLLEWIVGAWLSFRQTGRPLKPYWARNQYKSLLTESLPQLGVLLFDSALARTDWILLGLIAGPTATAEYSFAYKMFEASRLPMLVIAPLILPKFVRYLDPSSPLSAEKKIELHTLLKFESVISVLIPVFLNITWISLVGWLTKGKYGTTDAALYMILSACVPLAYYTNFCWTLAFAQHQLKLTLYISVTVSLLNIALNLLLIPSQGAMGAAIAYLISSIVQASAYKLFVHQKKLSVPIMPLIVSMTLASACTLGVIRSGIGPLPGVILGIGGYALLIILTKTFGFADLRQLTQVLIKPKQIDLQNIP